MELSTASLVTVLADADIERLPWEPLGAISGVHHKVLWRDAGSMAGVLRVDAGHRLGAHTHHANHHHLWLLEGRAEIIGASLGPGGYAHIPSGTEHDIDASMTDGCTVFYLYLSPTA
jgi:mannose-6-phosphate isomerase-like protein (cupin superfamily)